MDAKYIADAMHNPEAERSVLGALIHDRPYREAYSVLEPSDFSNPAHAEIFSAARAVHAARQPVDLLTLGAELSMRGKLETCGGQDYLIGCFRACPTSSNVASYMRIVAECSRRRHLDMATRKLTDALANGMIDVDDALADFGKATKAGRVRGERVSIADSMQETYDALIQAMEARQMNKQVAMQYGLRGLDAFTGGLWPGQLAVIAAKSSTGKSAMAMDVGVNVASSGRSVLVCSQEMSRQQYDQRIWARKAQVPLDKIIQGNIGDMELEILVESANSISKLPIEYIAESMTLERLRAIVDADPPDLLIVDYVQILKTLKHIENEAVRIGYVTTGLKSIAMDYKIPVLSLSQLSREGVKTKAMPTMSDLKGSSSIEQDADVLVLMHWVETFEHAGSGDNALDPPKYESLVAECIRSAETANEMRYVAIRVAKNRQGRLGWFPVVFKPAVMTILPVDEVRQ